MRTLVATVVALGIGTCAWAAPNVGNASQKGSLLVFPLIWADGLLNSTLVRIQNDGTQDVDVKCYWMDGYKNRVDFIIPVTRNQAVWFDATTGQGTFQVNPFPSGPANGFTSTNKHPFLGGGNSDEGFGAYGKGMLTCWSVDNGATSQIKWNHLSGTATVYQLFGGGAFEYSAFAFFVPLGFDLQPIGVPGTLNLNGVEYDACPLYLIGQFTPIDTAVQGAGPFPPDAPQVFGHYLSVSTCNMNLNQDWTPNWTKLGFDVWNEDEVKFTGAYECANSWHETLFSQPFRYRATPNEAGNAPNQHTTADIGAAAVPFASIDGIDAASQNFDWTTVGTYAARYRVQGLRGSQCDRVKPATGNGSDVAAVTTQAVGLIGVQATDLGGMYTAVSLAAAGKMTGRIVWDPAGVVPEGGVR